MFKIIYSDNGEFIAGFADYSDAALWFHNNCSTAHCEIVTTGAAKMPTEDDAERILGYALEIPMRRHRLDLL